MSDTRFLCKRCWRRPTLAETYYRCPECGQAAALDDWLTPQAADGLRPTADLLRGSRWNLAAGESAGVRCPDHPESALRLFCPCQEFLPPRSHLQRGDSLGLGFVGPHGAGKTVMILTMVQALQQLPGPDAFTPRVGLLGLGDTETTFQKLADELRAGVKPGGTTPESALLAEPAVDGAARNFCWELTLNGARRSRRWGFLAIYDVAGESWGQGADQPLEVLDRYLEICTSLVFLVDGATVARDLGLSVQDAWDPNRRAGDQGAADREWLGRLLDRLQPERSARSRLALVVSKADLLWQDERWQALRPSSTATEEEDPERQAALESTLAALLRESGRGQLLTMASGHFHEVRPFAASSLGFTPTAALLEGKQLKEPPRPVGVVEPILWLLEGR